MSQPKKIIKYIAIDWGEKRIGLAVADNETWLAMPLAVVYSIDELFDFLEKEAPDQLVVGMPYTMEGKKGKSAERVGDFINLLKVRFKVPIAEIDERLTSMATDSLYEKGGRPDERDAIAAMLILQTYIDQLDKGGKKAEKDAPKLSDK